MLRSSRCSLSVPPSLRYYLNTEPDLERVEKHGVRAVVRGPKWDENERIPLLRPVDDNPKGKIELAGGRVKPGETLQQGLGGELFEELGIKRARITRHLLHIDYETKTGGRAVLDVVELLVNHAQRYSVSPEHDVLVMVSKATWPNFVIDWKSDQALKIIWGDAPITPLQGGTVQLPQIQGQSAESLLSVLD